jgi:hypothetical protein
MQRAGRGMEGWSWGRVLGFGSGDGDRGLGRGALGGDRDFLYSLLCSRAEGLVLVVGMKGSGGAMRLTFSFGSCRWEDVLGGFVGAGRGVGGR